VSDPARRLATAQGAAALLGRRDWDRVELVDGGKGGVFLAWLQGRRHVVKVYDVHDGTASDGSGARERAALHTLAGAAGTPVLLAEDGNAGCVVMSHVDGEGSLADALLGDDPERAERVLGQWATTLAAVHAAGTPAARQRFTAALGERGPDLAPSTLATEFAQSAGRWSEVLEQLGLPPHPEGLNELRAIPDRLSEHSEQVLSPADTCPDNNVVAPDGVHLVDFEHAELRHRAWDVAYLRTPWPSCWCAWALPADVAEAAVARYVVAAGAGAAFEDDLRLATLGWQTMTPGWFVAGALRDDDSGRGPQRPSRRSFVLHRLAAARGSTLRPALAAMAGDLHDALRERWGEVALDLAPAFRG